MSFDFGSLDKNKKTSSSSQGSNSTSSKSTFKGNAPKVDFSNLGGTSNRTNSPGSGYPSSSRTTSRKTPASRVPGRSKGKKASLIPGVDNSILVFIGVGWVILMVVLVTVVLSFLGGNSDSQSGVNVSAQKRIYHDQAYEYTNKGEFDKAISAYEKAYELDPNDSYATDQISIIYRNNLHDEAKAEFWKSKSEQITANKVDSNRGKSTEAYQERAERLKKKHEAQNRR